jgi:arylsulfatase A-like enzyme
MLFVSEIALNMAIPRIARGIQITPTPVEAVRQVYLCQEAGELYEPSPGFVGNYRGTVAVRQGDYRAVQNCPG